MSYITPHVTRQRDEGFKLVIERRSYFRDSVLSAADWLCKVTGHRWCNTWFDKVYNWADKAVSQSIILPIDLRTANMVSWLQGLGTQAWDWVEED